MDEQKKSGLDLFYLMGIYAIVKIVREYKMGDQSGRPLYCVKLSPMPLRSEQPLLLILPWAAIP